MRGRSCPGGAGATATTATAPPSTPNLPPPPPSTPSTETDREPFCAKSYAVCRPHASRLRCAVRQSHVSPCLSVVSVVRTYIICRDNITIIAGSPRKGDGILFSSQPIGRWVPPYPTVATFEVDFFPRISRCLSDRAVAHEIIWTTDIFTDGMYLLW